jgi:hypothetical protein
MTLISEIITSPNLIATIALGVSFLSIIIGFYGLWLQRKHNQLSVRPIGIVTLSDYENRLAIKVKNAGMGTMIIKSIETSDNEGNKKEYPIDWFPQDIMWADFRKGLPAIKEGDSIVLLEYKLDPQNKNSEKERENIRSILKNLTIRIKYKDIYDKEQQILSRSLDWFGRNKKIN